MVRLVLDVTRLDDTCADLAPHTTLRLGGPAGRLVVGRSSDEIVQIIRHGPALILAGGSNVVIADEGVAGTVLLLRSTGVTVQADGDGARLTAEAGEPWDDVVARAVGEGLAGLECLSGIPGSAGATPIQNVGAYGQEVADTIAAVRVYDRRTDTVRDLTPDRCGFVYRGSVFRHDDRYVVLSTTFRLRRSGESEPVRYAELARALGVPVGGRAPLADVRAAVLDLRRGKGMVIDPADPDTFSAGSFFLNPVLDPVAYAELVGRAGPAGPPAHWPAAGGAVAGGAVAGGAVKVSAAWLIERAGFPKGYAGAHAGVAISGKHTLALTNRGSGTTAALLGLAREIRDGVAAIFGVTLNPEPVLVGCAL
jgi:UDP-N-acetylmuramate dehydrogenase